MLQTLNPYLNTDKTAEIMARYIPIAPKPDLRHNSEKKINQSPYLKKAWPYLQARPTRTRKRGRTSVGPPPSAKKSRSLILPNQVALVTLPLLPCPTDVNAHAGGEKIVDLNKIPQEKDFLQLLQGPTNVIAPQPVRPVGSSISIRSIRENPVATLEMQMVKKSEEVEEDIESERSPMVVTDSNNKVRLVNSAYKEMVGQPECLWLDSMVSCVACSSSKRRICGEVSLQFPDSGQPVCCSNGFSCWARIEWRRDGKKRSVDTTCNAVRVYCESKDYVLSWRFNTREVFESANSL